MSLGLLLTLIVLPLMLVEAERSTCPLEDWTPLLLRNMVRILAEENPKSWGLGGPLCPHEGTFSLSERRVKSTPSFLHVPLGTETCKKPSWGPDPLSLRAQGRPLGTGLRGEKRRDPAARCMREPRAQTSLSAPTGVPGAARGPGKRFLLPVQWEPLLCWAARGGAGAESCPQGPGAGF